MNKKRNKVTEYMKETNSKKFLPIKLVNKINDKIFNTEDYEYRTKNNFLRCIDTIYYHQVEEYHNLEYYVPLGSAYWKSIFSRDYLKKVIEPLIGFGIIESRKFGTPTFPDKNKKVINDEANGSVWIRYRINPDLTADDNFTTISYITKDNSRNSTQTGPIIINNEEFIYLKVPDKDFFVSIDKEKACQWVEENAEDICQEYYKPSFPDELPENMVIECHLYLNEGSFNTLFVSLKSAKSIAKRSNLQLFYFKDKFYIADPQEFLKYRIKSLKYQYRREISKIGNLPIINLRSQKTLRINNQLVSFPSKILKFININHETVVQLDLRTSQFLLFANLLNVYILRGEEALMGLFKKKQTQVFLKRLIEVLKEHQNLLPKVGIDLNNPSASEYSNHDVIKFIRDVFYEDFYTIVQKELQLSSRGVAKYILFKLLFKRSTKSDILTKKLAERYPIILSIIMGFKQEDKDIQNEDQPKCQIDDICNFSVFLQCVEAEIFIDKIFFPMREEKIPCFTRHDSIVVASSSADKVEMHARKVFQEYGFKYNHKAEDKFWEVIDFGELENSGYIDFLADDDLINTEDTIDENPDEIIKNSDSKKYKAVDAVLSGKDETLETPELVNSKVDTLDELLDLGVQDDYYDMVSIILLEELTNLPINEKDRQNLFNEIVNQRDGICFFQDKTNEIITEIVNSYSSENLKEFLINDLS